MSKYIDDAAGKMSLVVWEQIPAVPGSSFGRLPAELTLPWPLLPPASPSQAARLLPSLAFVPALTPRPDGSVPPVLQRDMHKSQFNTLALFRKLFELIFQERTSLCAISDQ